MSIAWGRPGIEVPHQWNGGVVLNARHLPGATARTPIDRITGYFSLAETDDQRYDAGSRRGEIVLPTYPRGKTVVYEGRVEAKTLAAWRTTYRSLVNAFRERSSEGAMIALGVTQWQFNARVMTFDADDEPDNLSRTRMWPFRGTFELALRQSDARYYALPKVEHHSGDGATVTNLGATDTDPTFLLSVGTAGDVVVTNTTIGRTLIFRDVPTGTHVLTFGGQRRGFTTGAGADLSGTIDAANSNWWDELIPGLVPGDNVLDIDGVTSWRCDYYHADE